MTLRVMLVEDEANILEAVRFLLSRDGWEVFGHGNGATAIEEIMRRAPDVIVLDVMLPGRSGLEILSDLRAMGSGEGSGSGSGSDDGSGSGSGSGENEDGRLAQTPVLMLTAKGQGSDRDRALALGANAYLIKPFANDELVETVRELVAAEARG